MNDLRHISPKRIQFSQSLAVVPMMGAVAERFKAATKADLRTQGAELDAELAALHGSLAAEGIKEPIPVTFMAAKEGKGKAAKVRRWVQGWDGRHRTEWALGQSLKTVPVRVVTEAEGRALLEATVVGRRHWTKGQRAWLAVSLHPAVADNTRATRKPKASDSVGSSAVITTTDLATRFGVSPDLIDQAVKIQRLFAAAPALREKHEPGIWLGHGLGAVYAGIPGATSTEDKPKKAISWTTMQGPLATLANVARSFAKWDASEQDAARDALASWLRRIPGDFRLLMAEAVAQSSDAEDTAAATDDDDAE